VTAEEELLLRASSVIERRPTSEALPGIVSGDSRDTQLRLATHLSTYSEWEATKGRDATHETGQKKKKKKKKKKKTKCSVKKKKGIRSAALYREHSPLTHTYLHRHTRSHMHKHNAYASNHPETNTDLLQDVCIQMIHIQARELSQQLHSATVKKIFKEDGVTGRHVYTIHPHK
jgi:outer membrane receptor for ferrienterochelin and colicin